MDIIMNYLVIPTPVCSPNVLASGLSISCYSSQATQVKEEVLMDWSACWCWCTSVNARSRCLNLLRTVFPNFKSAIQQPLQSVLVNVAAAAGRENPVPSHPLPFPSTAPSGLILNKLTSNQPFFLDYFSAKSAPQVTPKPEKGILGVGFSPFRLMQCRHWKCSNFMLVSQKETTCTVY